MPAQPGTFPASSPASSPPSSLCRFDSYGIGSPSPAALSVTSSIPPDTMPAAPGVGGIPRGIGRINSNLQPNHLVMFTLFSANPRDQRSPLFGRPGESFGEFLDAIVAEVDDIDIAVIIQRSVGRAVELAGGGAM